MNAFYAGLLGAMQLQPIWVACNHSRGAMQVSSMPFSLMIDEGLLLRCFKAIAATLISAEDKIVGTCGYDFWKRQTLVRRGFHKWKALTPRQFGAII